MSLIQLFHLFKRHLFCLNYELFRVYVLLLELFFSSLFYLKILELSFSFMHQELKLLNQEEESEDFEGLPLQLLSSASDLLIYVIL